MTAIPEELRWLGESAGVATIDDEIVLALAGDDARSWIHGMVTNDLRPLDAHDTGAIETAIVSVKGKLLALAWVYARGPSRLVAIPRDARVEVMAFFDRYIVMEDVVVTPRDDLRIVSVRGPEARDVIDDAGAIDLSYTNDRGGVAGLDVLVPSDAFDATYARIVESARLHGGGALAGRTLEIARLRAGRARWGVDVDGSHYPQEAGLAPRTVSFQKGCYVGQEVVCTLEMRGHVKKLLARVRFDGDEIPTAQDPLVRDAEVSGHVTSALRDPIDGRVIGLAMLKRAAAEPGVRVETAHGLAAEVVGLAS